MPNAKDFFSNMRGPMPLRKKLGLVLRNNATKVRKKHDCCGHPGEPGC